MTVEGKVDGERMEMGVGIAWDEMRWMRWIGLDWIGVMDFKIRD